MRKDNSKEYNVDLYHFEHQEEETLEELMKKKKERERRIKEKNRQNQEEFNEEFDFDTETVIGMTNKNNKKIEDEKRKQFSKNQRRKERRIKKIKLVLKIIVLLGLVAGAIVFATCSPFFDIKEIQALNSNQISSETIISLSGLKTGQNIFQFWTSDVQKNIKTNAYIESVKVKRKFPNKIEIEVQEREPKFSIPVLGQYAYMSSQGYVLEIKANELNLPIINGLKTPEESISPGNRINEEDLNSLETILKIMNSMKESNLDSKVTTIDISDKNDYIIYMQSENKKIHLGDGSNLSNKMLYVIAIIEEEKDKKGELFANGDLNDKFKVYFREEV